MLALSLSASDLAMVVVSNGRNLSDAMAQRRQRSAALRASKQQALAAAAQQISVAKPVEQLPLPAMSPALPASTPALALREQRRIPITTGGRTSSVPFRAPDLAGTSDADESELGTPMAIPVPVAQEKSGGLFSRVRTALPGTKSSGRLCPRNRSRSARKDGGQIRRAAAAAAGLWQGQQQREKPARDGRNWRQLRGRFFGGKQEDAAARLRLPCITPARFAPYPARLTCRRRSQ